MPWPSGLSSDYPVESRYLQWRVAPQPLIDVIIQWGNAFGNVRECGTNGLRILWRSDGSWPPRGLSSMEPE